jgi:beta-ureidopropionase / N-carbamoyl-L-amino-acid hydrolase
MGQHDVEDAKVAMAQNELALAVRAADAVDGDRLNAAVAELATFGGRDDGGVTRETLTETDLRARRYLIERARSLGCAVSIDDCGNLFFRRAGQMGLPPVLTGSHADTQPVGGKLDGAYGVVAALEVIEALNDAAIVTRRPIEVVSWTNEEGARFGPGAMGSSAFASPERLHAYRASRDAAGLTFGEALDAALAAVPDVERCALGHPIDSYVELHIEQGPVLESAGVPLGVVTGIQGVRWFEVAISGAACHAGTTPMEMRFDAMRLAQQIAQRLYAWADAARSTGLRLTLGRWRVAPNSINTVPGDVSFSIDVRCVDENALNEFVAALRATVAELGSQPGLCASVEELFNRATTRFPASMLEVIARGCAHVAASAREKSPLQLISGAFHDAMYVAELCPAAMIFVPSRNGISHNAAEYTEPRQLSLGAQALAHAVTELACR